MFVVLRMCISVCVFVYMHMYRICEVYDVCDVLCFVSPVLCLMCFVSILCDVMHGLCAMCLCCIFFVVCDVECICDVNVVFVVLDVC